MGGWSQENQCAAGSCGGVSVSVRESLEMRTGLVVVLGSVLLAAALAATGEKKVEKNEDAKKSGAVDDTKTVTKALDKKIRRVDEGREKKTEDKPEDISGGMEISTQSEVHNVSNPVNSQENNYINSTRILDSGLNVSKDNFSKFNDSEDFTTEMNPEDSEEYFTESLTTEYYDPKKFERRSDDYGDGAFIEDEVKTIRKSSPKLDKDMVELAFKGDQVEKIMSLLNEKYDPKKFQRRTFDIMGMLGLKNNNDHDKVVKIIKEVAVPVPYTVEKKVPVPVKVEVENPIPVHVPKAYPVTVEKKVYYPVKEYVHAPYPVYKKVPYLVKVAVEKPVPVHIEKPYPVYIERKVPYPVEKQIHYPVKVPVDRPVPVKIPIIKNIYYPVEKKVMYPVAVPVEKPVAVPVEKPYPVYVEKEIPVPVETHVPYVIPVEEQKLEETSITYNGQVDFKDKTFVPSEQIKIDFQNDEYGKTQGVFVPVVENHDTTKLQEKKDEVVTLEEPQKNVNTTEKPVIEVEKEKKDEESSKAKEKDSQEFGRRIKKS